MNRKHALGICPYTLCSYIGLLTPTRGAWTGCQPPYPALSCSDALGVVIVGLSARVGALSLGQQLSHRGKHIWSPTWHVVAPVHPIPPHWSQWAA